MDERRGFFRIENTGEMHAHFESHTLDVINISDASIVVRTDVVLPATGIIEFTIHRAVIQLNYEFLKAYPDNTVVLTFTEEEQKERLLIILKNIRSEHRGI
jgi:hypothetical protein